MMLDFHTATKSEIREEIRWVMERELDPTMITYQITKKVFGKAYECDDYPYRKVQRILNEMHKDGEVWKTSTNDATVWMIKTRDTRHVMPDNWTQFLLSEIPF